MLLRRRRLDSPSRRRREIPDLYTIHLNTRNVCSDKLYQHNSSNVTKDLGKYIRLNVAY